MTRTELWEGGLVLAVAVLVFVAVEAVAWMRRQ